MWAHHASTAKELDELLPKAVEAVLGGRGAVLDAHLGGGEGKFGGGESGGAGEQSDEKGKEGEGGNDGETAGGDASEGKALM